MSTVKNNKLVSLKELHRFDNFEVLARQVVEGSIIGLHKSPFHGFSVEFAEHRLYNIGDSLKNIDWNVYGRTDKLFIKKYEEETNLRARIVIDASSSMYFPKEENNDRELPFNKLAFSIVSAGALMHIFKKQRDAVGLSIFSNKVESHTRTRSTTVHHNLINSSLINLLNDKTREENVQTASAECLHEIAENTPRRSMVIIFSDMISNSDNSEEVFSALQHLKHNKHEVILFHVVDKRREMDFEFENRPHLFIDMESGEKIKVESNNLKDAYREQMMKIKKNIMMKCAQYRIDFVEADINKDFSQVMIPYLNKRVKMGI